jgi:glycosyltransferase involved in cell wall biosynthesis
MVVSTYLPLVGHGSVINNLCKRLSKIGFRVAIGAFSFEQDPPDNIEKVNLNRFKKLTSDDQGVGFDIIHNHHTKMNYYSLLTSKPFIFHYHGTSSRIQEINLIISMHLCKNRISRIISCSSSSLNQFRSLVSNVSSEVIYNGIDSIYYHPNLPRPDTKGDPQLLFVGNLHKYKNIGGIIAAMSIITELYPDAHLQIVGDGPEYKNLHYEIKKRKLSGCIELVGKLHGEKLRSAYSSCDIYISSSKLEAYPLPPVEAMACGKPVLLSDIPVHKELLEASKAGLAFSLYDYSDIGHKLKEVYDNRKIFSAAARQFSEKHDLAAMCDRVARIYEDLMIQQ